jgi:DNA-binding NtrC family response regulator
MKVLLADDEKGIAITLGDALRDEGHDVTVVGDGDSALKELLAKAYEILITDIRMPKIDGLTLLRKAKELHPDCEVVMITAYNTLGQGANEESTAFRAGKDGAFDFVTKPFYNELVLTKVRNIEKQVSLRRELSKLREEKFGLLVGRSAPMQKLFEQIAQVAKTDVTVLIEGETGTGKELVARQIHHLSSRRDGPFDIYTPGATTDTLLEGHLFGWVKGAFTGAQKDTPGLFERTNGGTVLLDDIDDMPMAIQAKLLRVLQEREIERLGDVKKTKINIRIITATKKNLWKMVELGTFRDDLMQRLKVAVIKLPALRERADDIPALVAHFVGKHGKGVEYKVEPDTMDRLKNYAWPGNVRELEHAVEAAITYAGDDKVLKPELRSAGGPSKTLADVVAQAEMGAIKSALAQTGGARGEAAALLGITRKALWMKMKEYGIE